MRVYFTLETLAELLKRARRLWKDAEVVRVENHRSKQVVVMYVNGVKVKLIVYRDGRIRSYSSTSPGVALAVKKMAERVLKVA